MAKVDPRKLIQKRRTADELRQALSALITSAPRTLPQDSDDPMIVLNDGIEELLELRAATEEMRGFVQTWQARFSRR